MQLYSQSLQVRWSDIDANFHVRHSVYFDWAASCRLDFFGSHGLTTQLMEQLHFGPILLREEGIYRREIRFKDPVTINMELLSARRDYSRWAIQHVIRKDPETPAAIITVEGAWMDTAIRKLAAPPEVLSKIFTHLQKGEKFTWQD